MDTESLVPITSLKFKHFPVIPKLTEDEVTELTKSIQEYGYIDAVVINDQNEILDGNHRAEIWSHMGGNKIPVKKMSSHPELNEDEELKEKFQIVRCLTGRKIKDIEARDRLLARLSEIVTKRKIAFLKSGVTSGKSRGQREGIIKDLENHGDSKETAEIAGVSTVTVSRAKRAAKGQPKRTDTTVSVRPKAEPKIPTIDQVCSGITKYISKATSILRSKNFRENFHSISPEEIQLLDTSLKIFVEQLAKYKGILNLKLLEK